MTVAEIMIAMEEAQSEAQLAAVFRKCGDAIREIEDSGDRWSYDRLRERAMILTERHTGTPFYKLLSTAMSGE